jgi:ABC-type antimicrobial peptide transport system permease subunit
MSTLESLSSVLRRRRLNTGGLSPVDSVTYAMVPAILVAVALLASLIPARRATRVNPVVAVRAD